MREKLGFHSLLEQTVTSKRIPRAMGLYRFVLRTVLGFYIGFPRLNQLRFMARDPIQSTFWRFVNALHLHVSRQMLTPRRAVKLTRPRLGTVAAKPQPGKALSAPPAAGGWVDCGEHNGSILQRAEGPRRPNVTSSSLATEATPTVPFSKLCRRAPLSSDAFVRSPSSERVEILRTAPALRSARACSETGLAR